MFKKVFSFMWIFLGMVLLMSGCGDKIEPGNTESAHLPPVKTEVAQAEISSQPFIYEAIGNITAQTSSTLSGKIMGTVKAVNVREGDSVKQGDILVVLDERQVTAGLQQSQAGLSEAKRAESAAMSARNAAKAGAELAAATYKRYKNLLKSESATRQEFEEVEARHRQAQAALAQAESMVAAARSRVQQAEAFVSGASISKKDAHVAAPYDGIVTAKMINAGDLASPGTPFLTLEKTGGFQAELVVPEHHIQAVRIEQTLEVTIPSLENSPSFTGIVQTIAPAADQKSRSFMLKVNLPESPVIRSGMFARVLIPVGERGIMLMPKSALVIQGQLTGYFAVDDKQTARFRLMRTGRVFDDNIEIISGVKPGTRYVVSPPLQLKDGMKVEAAS
ncbi:Efflux transporter, RND family [Desulfonema limicola]|uniref:Efflux transporter, RND family n=1 Tax=Desulfonema limicola TaxID=45656 RepID=A0A975B8T7_9BACT|nr:efflux RND transporter periplasmic adaptor subunit [Desulfonema limicola]QTA80843.1 Efflux transporter, RND family [Desulfonema limicola]